MLDLLSSFNRVIGNTPIIKLDHPTVELYCKLESHNLMGSIKMRSAYYILQRAIERGEITPNTVVIESSSGNFGVALAILCRRLGLQFIPVIDPNINKMYEELLRALCDKVVKVEDRDETGGYLLTRLDTVKKLMDEYRNCYWPNQYENKDGMLAHYFGIGSEIANQFESLDYAFIGVSTGGTISGVSRRLKEKFPNITIVAVDTEGSVIFGQKPKKRYIPGIGASKVPQLVNMAIIDEVVHIPEIQAVKGCHQLWEQHGVFGGGSTGSCYAAVCEYFNNRNIPNSPNVLFLCADNGMPYLNTVYNPQWVQWLKKTALQHV